MSEESTDPKTIDMMGSVLDRPMRLDVIISCISQSFRHVVRCFVEGIAYQPGTPTRTV